MNRISISQERLSLFLISLTFFAWWIEAFVCMFITWNMPDPPLVNLLSLYLFSLILPIIGLLVFMKNTKKTSSRWHWGIPLLIGLILYTFIRDFLFMRSFEPGALFQFTYGQSLVSSFDKWDLLKHSSVATSPIINFISVFFSLASALFCLSVPEEKRKIMMLPFVLSLVTAFSNTILFVEYSIRNPGDVPIFFYVYSISIIVLGLSYVRVSIIYDKK